MSQQLGIQITVECPRCGRSISERSEELVDRTGCLFCRGEGS